MSLLSAEVFSGSSTPSPNSWQHNMTQICFKVYLSLLVAQNIGFQGSFSTHCPFSYMTSSHFHITIAHTVSQM